MQNAHLNLGRERKWGGIPRTRLDQNMPLMWVSLLELETFSSTFSSYTKMLAKAMFLSFFFLIKGYFESRSCKPAILIQIYEVWKEWQSLSTACVSEAEGKNNCGCLKTTLVKRARGKEVF